MPGFFHILRQKAKAGRTRRWLELGFLAPAGVLMGCRGRGEGHWGWGRVLLPGKSGALNVQKPSKMKGSGAGRVGNVNRCDFPRRRLSAFRQVTLSDAHGDGRGLCWSGVRFPSAMATGSPPGRFSSRFPRKGASSGWTPPRRFEKRRRGRVTPGAMKHTSNRLDRSTSGGGLSSVLAIRDLDQTSLRRFASFYSVVVLLPSSPCCCITN